MQLEYNVRSNAGGVPDHCGGEEAVMEGKFSMYQLPSTFIPSPMVSLWVVTEKMRSQVHVEIMKL